MSALRYSIDAACAECGAKSTVDLELADDEYAAIARLRDALDAHETPAHIIIER